MNNIYEVIDLNNRTSSNFTPDQPYTQGNFINIPIKYYGSTEHTFDTKVDRLNSQRYRILINHEGTETNHLLSKTLKVKLTDDQRNDLKNVVITYYNIADEKPLRSFNFENVLPRRCCNLV